MFFVSLIWTSAISLLKWLLTDRPSAVGLWAPVNTMALQDIAKYKVPRYEQESSHVDQPYAPPLSVFLLHKEMSDHFRGEHEPQDQENPLRLPFHTLMAHYIRTLYPADSMLPIGQQYDEFPFLVFRSLNASEARSKIFTGKYLFMSRELNIINMLLSSMRE